MIRPETTLKELQDINAIFTEKINPDATLERLGSAILTEATEFEVSHREGDTSACAYEVADLILFGLAYLSQAGLQFEQIIGSKMERNFAKYPPQVVQALVSQGLTNQQALDKLKREWDTKRDSEYLK